MDYSTVQFNTFVIVCGMWLKRRLLKCTRTNSCCLCEVGKTFNKDFANETLWSVWCGYVHVGVSRCVPVIGQVWVGGCACDWSGVSGCVCDLSGVRGGVPVIDQAWEGWCACDWSGVSRAVWLWVVGCECMCACWRDLMGGCVRVIRRKGQSETQWAYVHVQAVSLLFSIIHMVIPNIDVYVSLLRDNRVILWVNNYSSGCWWTGCQYHPCWSWRECDKQDTINDWRKQRRPAINNTENQLTHNIR